MNTYNTISLDEVKSMHYKLLGYGWLCDRYGIKPVADIPISVIATDKTDYQSKLRGLTKVYSKVFSEEAWKGMSLTEHLLYAISNEVFNPYIIKKLVPYLNKSDIKEIARHIEEQPYLAARKLGYILEIMSGKELPIKFNNILTKRSNIPLLNENDYYTMSPWSLQQQRWHENSLASIKYKVIDNSLGDLSVMCPIVRKSEVLDYHSKRNYGQELSDMLKTIDKKNALTAQEYTSMIESLMSFRIENDTKDIRRIEGYERMLKELTSSGGLGVLNKRKLIDIQNRIVSSNTCDNDYRDYQNCIGIRGDERTAPEVVYVPPKAEDVPQFMDTLCLMHQKYSLANIDPMVSGAILHGAFVSIHPFSDGNGRISRLLVHDMLAHQNYFNGVVFPISDIIHKDRKLYESGLEDMQDGIIDRCDVYNDHGKIRAEGNDADLYRYMDMTPFVESLYHIVNMTLDVSIPEAISCSGFLTDINNMLSDKCFNSLTEKQKQRYGYLILDDGGYLSYNSKRQFGKVSDKVMSLLKERTDPIYMNYLTSCGYDNVETSENIEFEALQEELDALFI